MTTHSSTAATAAWHDLHEHYQQIREVSLRDLFAEQPERANIFSIEYEDLYLDFSKNRIRRETFEKLIELARLAELEQWRERMFAGEKINRSEARAVLHTALRDGSGRAIYNEGQNISAEIARVLTKMQNFCDQVRNGDWRGYTGKAIRHIVNIGIGGSALGPEMAVTALQAFCDVGLNFHFVANIDSHDLQETLQTVDPETTLFLIASKTFSTQETMTNANSARQWLLARLQNQAAVSKHFVAISTNVERVKEFGIAPENMFEFWDWVGGRYSLWSAIGLPIALAIGMPNFKQLLHGAYLMDQHFRQAPLSENIPVVLALLGIWYHNFFGAETHAVIPYAHNLRRLPAYLQQLDMESNGKSVNQNGEHVHGSTGPIVWGEPGTNGQHAFFQLMHQGTHLIPADFIIAANDHYKLDHHHDLLMANFLAQTAALMQGKTTTEAAAELVSQGTKPTELHRLAAQRTYPGNQPSNSIILEALTPKTLGMLLAMYEHKVFVQGVIWGINSFDQWGVELGKQIANQLIPQVTGAKTIDNAWDSSTKNLLALYHRWRHQEN